MYIRRVALPTHTPKSSSQREQRAYEKVEQDQDGNQ
jgi:hypothetical protein